MKRPYLVQPGADAPRSPSEDAVESAISPIEDIIEDARNGRPYILVDAEDRENEGDVIIPAQFATPEQINFMAKPAYSIVLPPPNVTGSLHMGHALEHTMMDALTRRKRMQGYEVLWQPGMDHAGIATQSVVEKQLAVDGKTKEDFGRELFVEKVWDWKRESGGAIGGQMRRLGDGVDWSRDRFTMDEGLSRAVRTIFKRLYDEGLIYQAERLVNWSPVLETAISDLEVNYQDVEGELVSFR